MSRLSILGSLLVFLALPALADDIIYSGTDLWRTPDDRTTAVDFASDPIPADFFCPGSKPFSGKVFFKGVPVATEPPGAFGNADTIIQRLDDAVFDRRGVAPTRLQIRALSMVSMDPIVTSCGPFDVAVGLTGEQQITNMQIVRQGENHGHFLSELGVHVKITFTPTHGRNLESRELVRGFLMHGGPDHLWATAPGPNGVEREGFVLVDTDNDGKPDTFVPGTSNFAVGWQEGPDGVLPGPQRALTSHVSADHFVVPPDSLQ